MLEGLHWIKNSGFLWDREARIYIDPWDVPDGWPPADAILFTHSHYDHFDLADVAKLRGPETEFWGPQDVAARLGPEVNVVSPGDAFEVRGHSVDAVPAYNHRPERLRFHPREKGWMGYVIALDGVRFYHAGDTDLVPEVEAVSCDVAMLPVGGHFTMGPDEAGDAAKRLRPRLAIPMHYGFVAGSPLDADAFVQAAAPIEVRVLEPARPFERTR
ncbi:MAG: MBL fold metallo-hydrolase [Actinomycetota bacterium]